MAESLTLPQLIEKWRNRSFVANQAAVDLERRNPDSAISAGEADALEQCADELAATLTALEANKPAIGDVHKANAQVIVNRLNAIRSAVGGTLKHPNDIKWQLGCLVNEIERGHYLRSSDYDAMAAHTPRADRAGTD